MEHRAPLAAGTPDEAKAMTAEGPHKGSAPARSRFMHVLAGISLVLIAANLRPVFSSLSVLLPDIRQATGMTAFAAGILTTLPVVCLGIFAPLAPRLAQRIGAERVLLLVLIVLAVGTAIRGTGSFYLLYLGAALAGGAIAVGNVLLPSVVKRDFPTVAPMMTGLYTMALCGGAAAAVGFTVPIKDWLDGSWNLALAFWVIPVLLVLVLWLPQALQAKHDRALSHVRVNGLLKDRLAWNVTLFRGLQSATAYIVFGWLGSIIRDRGLSANAAGVLISFSIMVQVITCLAVPSIAARQKSQSLINVILCLCAAVPLIGFLYLPYWTFWPLAVVQGIGQGGLIAAAMMMIVLRSPDAQVAAHLSGMAQGVGYCLAAFGPLLVGVIQSMTGSFAACGLLFAAIGILSSICGWGAGRPRHVNVTVERRHS